MPMKNNKLLKWVILFLFCFISVLTYARIAKIEKAKVVAENWVKFIVERDDSWGGSNNPIIREFTEFRKGDMLLGYYASVEPQGYIIISSLKDFAPIKAYSTTCNLDPNEQSGMSALLKDVIERRNKFLIREFGGLDEVSLQEIEKFTLDKNRRAWSYLLDGGSALKSNLQSIHVESAETVGPLITTLWSQGSPYNDDCPDMGCLGTFNHRAVVGCVPLAMAQIMKHYCWPPFYDWSYDWANMLVNEAVYDASANWYNDENGVPWTQTQVDAIADLCSDAGKVLSIDYGCNSTTAPVCGTGLVRVDAQDAFEDYFYYDTDGNEPECIDRDDYDYENWWNIIKNEINNNRPMVYRISNSNNDFAHAIVVDGYDNSGGTYKVHANYGWGNDWHNNWYDLDWFDCNTAGGWNTRCDWEDDGLIRYIYPRNGICGTVTTPLTLGPWGGFESLHHYIYSNSSISSMLVQGGAHVQFFPNISMISAGLITIEGSSAPTRFYSEGILGRGLKVCETGKIKVYKSGGILVR